MTSDRDAGMIQAVAEKVSSLTPDVTDKDWTASYSEVKRVRHVSDPKLPFLLNIRLALHWSEGGGVIQNLRDFFTLLFAKGLYDNSPDATISGDVYFWIEHAASASTWSPNISKQFVKFLEEEQRLGEANPQRATNEKLSALLEALNEKEVVSNRVSFDPSSSPAQELKGFAKRIFSRKKGRGSFVRLW